MISRSFESRSDATSNAALDHNFQLNLQGLNSISPDPPIALSEHAKVSTDIFTGSDPSHDTVQSADSDGEEDAHSVRCRSHFANLVRNVIIIPRITRLGVSREAARASSPTSTNASPRLQTEHVIMLGGFRFTDLAPKFKDMAATRDIAAHAALVKHIQVLHSLC